jgi:hypothetical protein
MSDFEARLEALDTCLFDAIPSQLFEDDRRSLLAVQRAVRKRVGAYRYLEIGSYRGGSLQVHLRDPHCERIYSIDKRPLRAPDDRGLAVKYAHLENTTVAMMEGLRSIAPEADRKVVTFEADASRVDHCVIAPAPEICFIDGEHTEEAVLADFSFCREVAAPQAVICFHDDNVVFPALIRIVEGLQNGTEPFEAYALPSYIFVIELGRIALHTDPVISKLLRQNWKAVLPSLMSMEHYREVYNTTPVRMLRAISRGMKRVRRSTS